MAAPRKSARHPDEQDLARRAFQAYWRFARPGEPVVTLETARAEVIQVGDRWYVILISSKKRIAVFRVRTDDKLKRITRIPRELRGDDD